MDVIFDLSPGTGGPLPGGREAAVVGCMTRSLPVHYRGPVDLLGVRFRPGAGAGFLDVDAHELTDRQEALADVWGVGSREWPLRLAQGSPAPGDRKRILDSMLLSRLEVARNRTDGLMVEAASHIVQAEGRLRIHDLARTLGLSRRQLERRFRATVGTSPKAAARIARFRAVVNALHRDPAVRLSSLALSRGYVDQAHMSRDFRALAGRSPGAYRSELRGA